MDGSGSRVVVVGGGFGGLQAVKTLARADVDVTLVDRNNDHLFQPLSYQVATGSLSPGEIAVPLRKVFRHERRVRVVMGEVMGFDLERREVLLDSTFREVNAGDFDSIADVADLCEGHGAWLHVDGAFGLFARLTPGTRALTDGVERADSVVSDGHKWLNVPYDCGFAFVREMARLPRALNVGAPYLPAPDDPDPNFGFVSPENSRRARALAVWATLRAYGRAGYREMIERHVRLDLAELVDASPELEQLADVPLNIVCFRAHPPGVGEERLNELNRRLGDALRADGRVFVGTTSYAGKTALRPAIVNWRTAIPDIELMVDVARELAQAQLVAAS